VEVEVEEPASSCIHFGAIRGFLLLELVVVDILQILGRTLEDECMTVMKEGRLTTGLGKAARAE
jgi:hypothetical protein